MLPSFMTSSYKQKEKGFKAGPLQIATVSLTEHNNTQVLVRSCGSSFYKNLRYRQRIPKPSTRHLERASSCKLRSNIVSKLDIQVVGLSNQSSEINFLTVPNNSPKSAYFIHTSDKPDTEEDQTVLQRNDTDNNQPENGDPLDEKEKVALAIIGQQQSTCTTTILSDITSKPVTVTKSNSSDVEDNKCPMSELIMNHIPAVENDINPEIKQSITQNIPTSPNPHISDEVSVIGKNIIGHDATKVYIHNLLDFNPGIVKHTGLSCDKCVHRLKEQKPWKYGDTLHLRMSRWIHTVQNATCTAKNCESPLSGATSSLGKTSPDSKISLTEVSVRENPDALKVKERIRNVENVQNKPSPSRIQYSLDDENDKGKYESHLQNETNTDTTISSQPDSSEKISKTSTPRVRPILKCWSDIWPLSTNTYLQRKEISSKLKDSPKEHPKEDNHEKCKENTKISIKDKMNIDYIGMKEKEQEKAEVKEKIEEDMLSSISPFSPLEHLEAKSSSSDITPQMHPVKDLSKSSNRNMLLGDINIPSHGTKGTESIGPHQPLNTRDVPSVLVVLSVPGVPTVQDVPSSPDEYVQSVLVVPSVSGVPSVHDIPRPPGVYRVQDVSSVPNGPDITNAQITCADAGKYKHLKTPAPAEGENYFFQAMIDKRYNRWKRRRQKKEKLVRPRTCLPSAYSNTSSSSEEDVRRRAISGYGAYVQNVVNSNNDLDCRRSKAGKKRSSGKGSRKGSHRKMPTEDELTKLNGYDASSEYTSSEKEQVQGRESDSDNNRSHESNLNSDDNICPVVNKKYSSMSTLDITSSDLLDVLGNDLWLPPINDQMTSSERKTSPEDLCQSDRTERHLLKLHKKKSASSLEQPGLKEALHKKVHRQSIRITQSKSRITKQSINSQETSGLRMKQGNSVLQTISRFRSSSWIDAKMKSETLSRMSFIAPTGKPLESYSQLMKSRTVTVEKKDFLPSASMPSIKETSDKSKASDEKPYLPMLIQNNRKQTIPKLKNRLEAVDRESRSIINPVSRKTCGISAKGESNSRCGSDPLKRQLSITATHLLPYNRKLDTRFLSKYHVQHTTVTPKSSWAELQEGNKRFNLQRKTESTVSNLSFTPAFTFSIFKLPLDYKLRNEKWRQIIGHPLKHKT